MELERPGLDVKLLFVEPRIAGNTGSTIRLAAITGAELHIAGPFGFDLDDAKLKRAGLDYHDLAHLVVHADVEEALAALTPARVFAFTGRGELSYTEVDYQPNDVLMFGSEPDGLPAPLLVDPRVTAQVRIPMLPGRRSLNLSMAAGIVAFEAWRQAGFAGADSPNLIHE